MPAQHCTLPLPPTTNHTYFHRGRMVFKSQVARTWETTALLAIKEQEVQPLPEEAAVAMILRLHLKRDRDIDSSQKIVLDIFAKAGIYKNDSKITRLVLEKYIDKENPRIEAIITTI